MNETKELKAYQRASGERVEEIAFAIGVSARTVYRWINQKADKRIHPLPLHRLRLFLKRKNVNSVSK
jgi:transposase